MVKEGLLQNGTILLPFLVVLLPLLIFYYDYAIDLLNSCLNKINNSSGYYHICLINNGKMQYQLLHRLIAQAFIPNPHNKPFINHIDGDKKSNKIDNLEWVTNKENIRHAFEIGLMNGKPSTRKKQIIQIDKETNKVICEYNSQLEASKKLNIHPGSLSQCLNGKYKTAGGYIWKYKEEK